MTEDEEVTLESRINSMFGELVNDRERYIGAAMDYNNTTDASEWFNKDRQRGLAFEGWAIREMSRIHIMLEDLLTIGESHNKALKALQGIVERQAIQINRLEKALNDLRK